MTAKDSQTTSYAKENKTKYKQGLVENLFNRVRQKAHPLFF